MSIEVLKNMTNPVQNLQLRNDSLDLAHVMGVLRPGGTERVLIQEQLCDILTPLQDTLQQYQYIRYIPIALSINVNSTPTTAGFITTAQKLIHVQI